MALERFGDWDLVLNLSANMGADTLKANRIALAQIASRAEAMAVKFMRDQSLPWKALSAQYLEYKIHAGLSEKIYIATTTYFQAVTSKVYPQQLKSFAGVFRKQREKNGEFVADIAKVLEYGSVKRNIPPRRFWSVVYRDMRVFLIKEKMFAKQAVAEYKKRTRGKG